MTEHSVTRLELIKGTHQSVHWTPGSPERQRPYVNYTGSSSGRISQGLRQTRQCPDQTRLRLGHTWECSDHTRRRPDQTQQCPDHTGQHPNHAQMSPGHTKQRPDRVSAHLNHTVKTLRRPDHPLFNAVETLIRVVKILKVRPGSSTGLVKRWAQASQVLPGLVQTLGGVADFLAGLGGGVSRTAKPLIRVDERSSVPVQDVTAEPSQRLPRPEWSVYTQQYKEL